MSPGCCEAELDVCEKVLSSFPERYCQAGWQLDIGFHRIKHCSAEAFEAHRSCLGRGSLGQATLPSHVSQALNRQEHRGILKLQITPLRLGLYHKMCHIALSGHIFDKRSCGGSTRPFTQYSLSLECWGCFAQL